jgi:hypothetical protein
MKDKIGIVVMVLTLVGAGYAAVQKTIPFAAVGYEGSETFTFNGVNISYEQGNEAVTIEWQVDSTGSATVEAAGLPEGVTFNMNRNELRKRGSAYIPITVLEAAIGKAWANTTGAEREAAIVGILTPGFVQVLGLTPIQ